MIRMGARRLVRRFRRAMTLVEVMVVIALLLLMAGVFLPAVADLGTMEQRRSARELAFLYNRLRDEAVMQNVSFRVTYRLNKGTWRVETGEPGALIHADRESREDWERQQEEKLSLMDEAERKAWAHTRKPFEKMSSALDQEFSLPSGLVFGAIYTPADTEPVEPDGKDQERERKGEGTNGPSEEERFQKVYSHVFADGTVEQTVLWIVDADDPEEGYTIEIEPLSGRVQVTGEVIEFRDLQKELPDSPPELPG